MQFYGDHEIKLFEDIYLFGIVARKGKELSVPTYILTD
jgi:hypothetical protein